MMIIKQQKEKDDFAAVAGIAELPMTEAPAESVTDTETETSAEPTEQPAAERNIQALIAENSDCIGWLSIDGTNKAVYRSLMGGAISKAPTSLFTVIT